MTFEVDLRSRVKAALPGKTVEWDERPQESAYPAVILETIAGERLKKFSGVQGTQRDRVQFNVFAKTKAVAVTMRNTIMDLVEAAATAGGTVFQPGTVILHRSDVEPTDHGTVHIEIVDAYLWHS